MLEKITVNGYITSFEKAFLKEGIKGVRDKYIDLKSHWNSDSKEFQENISLLKATYEYFFVIKFIRAFQEAYENEGASAIHDRFMEFGTEIENAGIYNTYEQGRITELLNASKDFMSSFKLRTQVGQMDNATIFRLVREKKLDKGERRYDMSDLFDENLIKIIVSNSTKRRDVFQKEIQGNGKKFDFLGRSITITPIAGLVFGQEKEEVIGEEEKKKKIIKYLITIKYPNNDYDVMEVYSDIDFQLLDEDEEYKELVAKELLSEKNIVLAKADGYIGKIEKIEDCKKSSSTDFVHELPSDYVLHYDATELSAVGIVQRNLLIPKGLPLEFKEHYINYSKYLLDRKLGIVNPNEITATDFFNKYGIDSRNSDEGDRT